MPVTRELSLTYAGLTFGGSTARQITSYTFEDSGWEDSFFEFEFVTSATTDAAFNTELAAVRNAFRTPRDNLVVTQNGQNLISWRQSDNTGLDSNPRIIKDGDPADTGLSRHFRVRIEFGQPADRIAGLNFRRYSTITTNYSPERVRTVTIVGVYTANSTDGTTTALAQYLAQIATYASSVTTTIDSTATWERIGEPEVEYNDTNKLCRFIVVYREIIFNQAQGVLNDAGIVNPIMNIVVERWAPGDSFTGEFTFGSAPTSRPSSTFGGGAGHDTTPDQSNPQGGGFAMLLFERPIRILITYDAGIDQNSTKALTSKWKNTIRPFLIAQAVRVASRGVTLVKEDPGYDDYQNRISASLEFISYSFGAIIEQSIQTEDRTSFGRILAPTTSPDVYAYYEWPGPAQRQRICRVTYKQALDGANANAICDGLVVKAASQVNGLTDSPKWMPVSNAPAVKAVKQGLLGSTITDIAEVTIERVAQWRNKVTASVAKAGGITGAGLTG